jgi:hypothetical protein
LYLGQDISDNTPPKGGLIIVFNYENPDDPNYDPYWGDKETGYSEMTDYSGQSDLELEELEEKNLRELREEGIL